jgi:hypothetical protein
MSRSLDQILIEELGIKDITLARLLWQVENLKEQIEALKKLVPADEEGKSHE